VAALTTLLLMVCRMEGVPGGVLLCDSIPLTTLCFRLPRDNKINIFKYNKKKIRDIVTYLLLQFLQLATVALGKSKT
jgi:hypothetical protein